MIIDIVKVTHSRGQTRITIPKRIAEETGLDKASMVEIEQGWDKSLVVKEWHGGKTKKRDIQKNQN